MDLSEKLKLEYEKTCASHQAITNFRGQLLGFLPLASGAAIFLLASNGKDLIAGLGILGVFIGLFGVLITVGLFLHELYGIQTCLMLIERGTALERALGFKRGQFQGLKQGRVRDYLGPKGAAVIIYSTVCAAWVFVAFASASSLAGVSPAIAALVAAVAFLSMLVLGILTIDSYEKDQKAERDELSKWAESILAEQNAGRASTPE